MLVKLRGLDQTNSVLGPSPTSLAYDAQVCMRWVIERGAVVAAGTGSNATTAPQYAKENLAIYGFALTAAEMHTLNNLQL